MSSSPTSTSPHPPTSCCFQPCCGWSDKTKWVCSAAVTAALAIACFGILTASLIGWKEPLMLFRMGLIVPREVFLLTAIASGVLALTTSTLFGLSLSQERRARISTSTESRLFSYNVPS